MKKILMGSAVLTAFSLAIIAFQLSCQKTAGAQTGGTPYVLPSATTSTLGGVIVGSGLNVTSSGVLSANSSGTGLTQLNKILYTTFNSGITAICIANYDGTNSSTINITLPSGYLFADGQAPGLSPDGTKIFFIAGTGSGGETNRALFSCNIDGTNVTSIVANAIVLGGAY